MSERFPLQISAGTTFRCGFRMGEDHNTDHEVTYDQTDILAAKFKMRSGDNRMTDSIPLLFEDGIWWLTISANLTDSYPSHRALYWSVDATFASGDVVRMVQGPVRVRTIGGRS